ncbi:MAG: TlpA disulfide reductase family protein [Candidatus Omnitrophota bacterium]
MRNNARALLFSLIFILFFSSGIATAQDYPRPAPEFNLADLDGNYISLKDYRGKNGVILLFWTSWCSFCRKELKAINNMTDELRQDGWEFFPVNAGESGYKARSFLKSSGLSLKALLDEDNSVSDSYNVFGVPTYIFINKEGYIIYTTHFFSKDTYKKLTP